MIRIRTMLMAGAAAVSLLAAVPVQAADGATNKGNTVSKPTANSQDNYKYDRLFWDHAVPAWSYSELQGNESPTYCLPRSTVVIGQSAGLTSVAPRDGSDPDSGGKKKTDTKTEGQFLEVIVNPAHEFG